jgi:hypothetical protein
VGRPPLRRADALPARTATALQLRAVGSSTELCRGACAPQPNDRTRSGAVVHAGFDVSLSEDPMTELFECKGLVNSLHSGPLMVLLAQDIDMITMPDEILIFSRASFDEVRRSHCHEVSSMLSPACDHPCLQISRSLVPSCCRAAPDTALCPSPDALRLTLPYRLTRLYHLHGRPDDGRRARGATRPRRAATLLHAHGCTWAIELELHSEFRPGASASPLLRLGRWGAAPHWVTAALY